MSDKNEGPGEEDGKWAEGHEKRFAEVDPPVIVHEPKIIEDFYILEDTLTIKMSNKIHRMEIKHEDSAYKIVNALRGLADSIMKDEL